MSADKFLDLDIKQLFEQYTIKDIELIQKQIQNESERKKIELRTLVGERYRDLIQAADSIAEMKQTSESIVERIISIEKTCHDLQQKYLMGFKMEIEQINVEKEPSCISDSVVMLIKILMDIPEQIWSSIDTRNFLLASQLFLLAQHINYSLTFEVGDSNLSNKYPIVSKQWGIINQFKSLIMNFCEETLQSIELSEEVAANCLAALVLLDGLNSSDLLSRLISFRSQAIKSIALSETDLTVKNNIKLCLNILIKTIPLISNCFIKYEDNEDGLVSKHISDINHRDAIFLLSEFDLGEEMINKYLPLVAKNHKPFVEFKLEKLPLTSIQESIDAWFKWVEQLIITEITRLLNLVTSIKGIHNVREECLAVAVPENWDYIWELYSLPSVNFWSKFFQPLLTERVKGILKNNLAVCFNNFKIDITEFLNKVIVDTFQFPENDLRWFLWNDTDSDIPQRLTESGSSDNKRPLLMKVRGLSPNILKLCENFENNLSEMLSHLKQYLYELEQRNGVKDDLLEADIYLNSLKFSDRSLVQEYLQAESRIVIEDFVAYAKEELTVENPKCGQQDVNAIVLARLLQAISILCPNFKECFTISRSTGFTLTNIKWQEVCDRLKQESTSIWSIWAKCFKRTISHHRNNSLIKENIQELRIHTVILEWEKVMIEEEAEEGKRIESEILVPYQPAVHLQKFLSAVCRDLNKALPHTIPKTVLNEIINSIVLELFDYYYSLSTNLDIRQKQAIQILFDVKYISLLMVPRDNKSIMEESNKVSNVVIAKIDPFDFDVFSPFINTNVKKSVQRSLLIFGNLVPHMEQLHSILGARIEHSEGSKSVKDPPGILALCTGAPWFPSLTITAPVQNLPTVAPPLPDKAQQKKKQSSKEHTRTDSTGSTIKSGAAAFFGAMGSDWFGTS
ncbi:PREDICTED: conserved oligomeric Golgi complex subunit 1 [Ceratosolen solmsi marchali]|uniref:Conserved oligomeric Golgi complex subunit 1 n=1 Tax=Ceratosolen solmsi marchali TaxID=326594 RepID=A0AAJ7DWL7_9HYME|nr:PREDICTED: conserved oligomeric Golgi complex subunit 1 [Ceratosolen solmsi marchali]